MTEPGKFTGGSFIASTIHRTTGDRYIYVLRYDGELWTYTVDRAQALRLTARQADRFKQAMRDANQLAILEPVT